MAAPAIFRRTVGGLSEGPQWVGGRHSRMLANVTFPAERRLWRNADDLRRFRLGEGRSLENSLAICAGGAPAPLYGLREESCRQERWPARVRLGSPLGQGSHRRAGPPG